MTPLLGIAMRGTGRGIPQQVVTNAEFEKTLDTSDAWIVKRTGIRERHLAGPGETTLTMALEASRQALDDAGMAADELDLIIVGTISPHYPLPATSCLLQAELGLKDIPAFDIGAACCGFMYSMIVAHSMIKVGTYRNVLMVGAEHMSSIMDREDRASCILFGDGAGAAVFSARPDSNQGLLHSSMGADGAGAKLIWIPGGGGHEPVSPKVLQERLQYVRMQGREVYKFAVQKLTDEIETALAATGLTVDDLALIIPHQSNLRIIESVVDRLKLPVDKVVINIDRYGNTSSASVGICLDEARREGRVREGDVIFMAALGAGLTWASALVQL